MGGKETEAEKTKIIPIKERKEEKEGKSNKTVENGKTLEIENEEYKMTKTPVTPIKKQNEEERKEKTKAQRRNRGLTIDITNLQRDMSHKEKMKEEEEEEEEEKIRKPGKIKMGLSINTKAIPISKSANNTSRDGSTQSSESSGRKRVVTSIERLKLNTIRSQGGSGVKPYQKSNSITARHAIPQKHHQLLGMNKSRSPTIHSARMHQQQIQQDSRRLNRISTDKQKRRQEAKRRNHSVRTPNGMTPTLSLGPIHVDRMSKSTQPSPDLEDPYKKWTPEHATAVHSPNARFQVDTRTPNNSSSQGKKKMLPLKKEETLSPMAVFNLTPKENIPGGLMVIEDDGEENEEDDAIVMDDEDGIMDENHGQDPMSSSQPHHDEEEKVDTTFSKKKKKKKRKQHYALEKKDKKANKFRTWLSKLCPCFAVPMDDAKVSDDTQQEQEVLVNPYVHNVDEPHQVLTIPSIPLPNKCSPYSDPPSSERHDLMMNHVSSPPAYLSSSRSYHMTPSISNQSLSFMDDVEVLSELAETASSVVRIGRSPSINGLVLIKQPSIASSIGGNSFGGNSTCSTPALGDNIPLGGKVDEFELISRLEHPHIATVYGQEVMTKAIISKFYPETLHDWILRQGRLTVVDARRVIRELLSAVHYLQSVHGFIHGDIKSQNILMSDHSEVKLADFGAARYLGHTSIHDVPATEMVMGTKRFSAPEHILQHVLVPDSSSDSDSDDGFPSPPQIVYRISKVSDCWSIGLVLFECLTGTQAFSHLAEGAQTEFDIIGRLQLQFSKHPSILDLSCISNSDARDFIEQCLVVDPLDRPSIHSLSNHPYVH